MGVGAPGWEALEAFFAAAVRVPNLEVVVNPALQVRWGPGGNRWGWGLCVGVRGLMRFGFRCHSF